MSLVVGAVQGRLLVVDGGAQAGVASAGPAADDRALSLANALVGNHWAAPALELLLGPCTLLATTSLWVAVAGGEGPLFVDDVAVEAWTALHLLPGQRLGLGACRLGLHRTIALRGGVANLVGRQLGRGGSVDVGSDVGSVDVGSVNAEAANHLQGLELLRVVAGHELPLFAPEAFSALLSSSWRVSPTSNRRGVRLEGEALPVPSISLVTVPVWTGALQVPPSGQPLILGADSTTTGGYPRLAHVIAVDRFKLGQLRPGSLLRFTSIPLDEARALHRTWQQRWQPRPDSPAH